MPQRCCINGRAASTSGRLAPQTETGIILRTRPCRALTGRVRETGGGGGGRAREAGGGGGVFRVLAGVMGRENGFDQGFIGEGFGRGCEFFVLVCKGGDRRNARRRSGRRAAAEPLQGTLRPIAVRRRSGRPATSTSESRSAAFRPAAARRRSGRLSGAPPFFVPASVVPVPAQVRFVLGHDQQMEPALGYDPPAPRTQVGLGGRLRLDMTDGQPPRNAHATRAAVRTSAPATRNMSAARRRCLRNGLNPMPRCYRRRPTGRARRRAGAGMSAVRPGGMPDCL